MMPGSGGLGTYASVSSGHFISIGVALGGYLAIIPFAGPAEMMLLERILDMVYPGKFSHVGIWLILVLTILNLVGIDIFSSVQNIIVYVLLVSLLVIGITGLNGPNAQGISLMEMKQQATSMPGSILSLVVLALWAFCGLEYLCPFIEEARNPRRDMPRTMLLGAFTLLVIYGLVAYAAMRQVPHQDLTGSAIPHWLLVESLFGKSAGLVMVIFVLTASSSVTNSAIASMPRMLYGMARQGQLPAIFGKLHPRWNTPWFGILLIAALVIIPLVAFANAKEIIFILVISAAIFWLAAYIVAHISVIILRYRYPKFHRPFKSPLYPFPQVLGILGMGYAILHNSPSPELSRQIFINSIIIFLAISLYAFLWVRFKMKKGLLETESIDAVNSRKID
jgi:amino acid transporter